MVRRSLSLSLLFLVTAPSLAHGTEASSRLPAKLTEVLRCKSSRMLMCDLLYPIGFSQDGKLAYIHIPADEAVGEYLWAFRVVDLVTDEIVAALDWQTARSDEIQSLSSLLQYKRGEFATLLSRYNIVPLAAQKLERFPVRYGGAEIVPSLLADAPRTDDASLGWEVIAHHVRLRDARGRSKEIGKVDSIRDAGMPLIYPPKLLGYLRSPFEPRVVVVLEQEKRGYEGPPNVRGFVLLGAHLRAGFARRAE